MSPIEHASATIEALEHELRRPNLSTMFGTTTVPVLLLQDAQNALVFALDEIAQLQEERREAVQLAVKLATKVADLEDEISEYETADILADQRLDYLLASR